MCIEREEEVLNQEFDDRATEQTSIIRIYVLDVAFDVWETILSDSVYS